MGIILKDIDEKKRSGNTYEKNQNEMKDVSFYTSIAKKCISMFAGSPTSSRMLKDEDAISKSMWHMGYQDMENKDVQ